MMVLANMNIAGPMQVRAAVKNASQNVIWPPFCARKARMAIGQKIPRATMMARMLPTCAVVTPIDCVMKNVSHDKMTRVIPARMPYLMTVDFIVKVNVGNLEGRGGIEHGFDGLN